MVFALTQEGSFTSIIFVGPWWFLFHPVQKYELPNINPKKVKIKKKDFEIWLPPFFWTFHTPSRPLNHKNHCQTSKLRFQEISPAEERDFSARLK